MDEHGLPIVGAGVDYTKVCSSCLSLCVILLISLALGSCSGTQEDVDLPQPFHHTIHSVPQQILHRL